eukprot:1192583-Prorocentrum_minimum.AAC.3
MTTQEEPPTHKGSCFPSQPEALSPPRAHHVPTMMPRGRSLTLIRISTRYSPPTAYISWSYLREKQCCNLRSCAIPQFGNVKLSASCTSRGTHYASGKRNFYFLAKLAKLYT